jgi:hypothetical protein
MHLGLSLAILTLLMLVVMAPLAYPGFLQAHSGFLPVYHAHELAAGANLFAWTPRTGTDFDVWRSDGRLPYWIAALAIRAGLSGTAAVRLAYALALGLGAWGMHAWTRRWLSAPAVLLAALVYAFLPWTLVVFYVRGALGEAWLWGIAPWLLWGIAAGAAGSRRGWAVTALAAALLLWSQAGLAVFVLILAFLALLFTPVIHAASGATADKNAPLTPQSWGELDSPQSWGAGGAIFPGLTARTGRTVPYAGRGATAHEKGSEGPSAGRQDRPRTGVRAGGAIFRTEKRIPSLIALAVGVAVGLLGLIPWLGQSSVGPNPAFGEHFLYLFQLLLPQWGNDISRPGWQDALSFQVGAMALGLALLAAYGWHARQPRPERDCLLLFAGGVTLVVLLLTLGWAAPLWRITGAQHLLTYPWQLLTIAAPWLSLAASSAADLVAGLEARPRWAVLAGLVVLASYPYLMPSYTQVEPGPAPVAIFGENQIALIDAQLTGELQPGGLITVTLTWQALKPMELDYTVFIHVLDQDDRIRTQRDKQPQDGQRPTNIWAVGEIVRDEHPMRIMPTSSVARYHVILGLYDWRTGQRLRVGDTNFVRLEPGQ